MKNTKTWKTIYTLLVFLGIVLMVFEIHLYRKTIISVYVPIAIFLTVGLFATYLDKNMYRKVYLSIGTIFPFLQNTLSWGFISCYLFMAANYYIADPRTTEYKFKIKEKSYMQGSKGNRYKRQPLVKFDYFNREKELVFRYLDTEKVNSADSVKISVRNGYFGFEVIDHYDVVH